MFQLGEILKAYGHFQEAALHLRHVLELRPNHEPALAILKEMEASPDSTVHVYTLLIIGIENLGQATLRDRFLRLSTQSRADCRGLS